MTGHMCPECGGERSARPGAGCACGAGTAARTGRDARAAEVAAAEDFDPLRIRPYVTLNSGHTQDDGAPGAATTMPLFLDGAPGGAPGPGAPGPVPSPPPGAVTADEAHRRTAAAYAGSGPDPVQPRRRRPFAVVAVGAAVAAVVGTAAFAGGLFDDDDSRDTALPPEVTTSAPDASSRPAASVSASPSASPSATPSRSASASPSASASASPTPSKSPSASPSAAASESPSPSASATKAPTTAAATPPAEELSGVTLRRGDRGSEVSELQRRLQEIWVYRGPDDGAYTERVEEAVSEFQRWVSVRSDPPGVYGPETRRALEAQTSGRGRRS
ncbi:peptidoglycan-binding domain-containing protein [Streptomyces atroolivaceus]|uniref:peptidoglycan-binding domain-containing protein n=1 Tax=Streptomyces atroolivaceus TaxID=66869 RepID=UPI002024F13C|nr:peptidoglycan-binding domain-containing protein [Streptomyces atroolivaceus]